MNEYTSEVGGQVRSDAFWTERMEYGDPGNPYTVGLRDEYLPDADGEPQLNEVWTPVNLEINRRLAEASEQTPEGYWNEFYWRVRGTAEEHPACNWGVIVQLAGYLPVPELVNKARRMMED